MVGVCSLTLMEGQNINFAVPARLVLPFIERSLAVERALIQPLVLKTFLPSRWLGWWRHREEGTWCGRPIWCTGPWPHTRGHWLCWPKPPKWPGPAATHRRSLALLDRMNRESPNYPPARQIRSALLAQEGQCDAAVREARAALEQGARTGQAAEAHAVLASVWAGWGRRRPPCEMDLALGSENIAVLPAPTTLYAPSCFKRWGVLKRRTAKPVTALRALRMGPAGRGGAAGARSPSPR